MVTVDFAQRLEQSLLDQGGHGEINGRVIS